MNILFLDIDGVLQPYDSENRFYSDKKIVTKLSMEHSIDYSKYSFYDIAAVYYDWDNRAVARLKYILDETTSKIIISSDWRSEKQSDKMRDLLAIHKLDKYYFADNIILDKTISLANTRALEIKKSLNNYNINNYVIIDDMEKLADYFPNNTVITKNIIGINDMNRAIKILKRKKL